MYWVSKTQKLTLYVCTWETLQTYVCQRGSTNKIVRAKESLLDVDTKLCFMQSPHILIHMAHLLLYLKQYILQYAKHFMRRLFQLIRYTTFVSCLLYIFHTLLCSVFIIGTADMLLVLYTTNIAHLSLQSSCCKILQHKITTVVSPLCQDMLHGLYTRKILNYRTVNTIWAPSFLGFLNIVRGIALLVLIV